jgi:hypothetical protein
MMIFFIRESFLEIGIEWMIKYDSITLMIACEVKQCGKHGH